MCLGCYREYDSPALDTPAIREAARAIAEVYEHSPVGGALHVAIDDWNLDSIEWCKGEIDRYDRDAPDDYDSSPGQRAAEHRCADLLLPMTEAERGSALAFHDGFHPNQRDYDGREPPTPEDGEDEQGGPRLIGYTADRGDDGPANWAEPTPTPPADMMEFIRPGPPEPPTLRESAGGILWYDNGED